MTTTSPCLDVAHEAGADRIERAGLGAQDRRAVDQRSQHQRPQAPRIARADQLAIGEADKGVAAVELAQRVDEAVLDPVARWSGQ